MLSTSNVKLENVFPKVAQAVGPRWLISYLPIGWAIYVGPNLPINLLFSRSRRHQRRDLPMLSGKYRHWSVAVALFDLTVLWKKISQRLRSTGLSCSFSFMFGCLLLLTSISCPLLASRHRQFFYGVIFRCGYLLSTTLFLKKFKASMLTFWPLHGPILC